MLFHTVVYSKKHQQGICFFYNRALWVCLYHEIQRDIRHNPTLGDVHWELFLASHFQYFCGAFPFKVQPSVHHTAPSSLSTNRKLLSLSVMSQIQYCCNAGHSHCFCKPDNMLLLRFMPCPLLVHHYTLLDLMPMLL